MPDLIVDMSSIDIAPQNSDNLKPAAKDIHDCKTLRTNLTHLLTHLSLSGLSSSSQAKRANMNVRIAIPGVAFKMQSGQAVKEALGVSMSDAILVLNEAEGGFWSASTILGDLLLQRVEIKAYGKGTSLSILNIGGQAFSISIQK